MDIANIAGVTITLPGLLSGAWSALKFAYDLYGQVDLRRTQLKLFLDRCSDLLLRVAQSLPASEVDVSARMRENVDYLQVTCQSLRDVIDKLKRKGFLWCMLNQDKIDTQISDVQSRIADTFVLFNVSSQSSFSGTQSLRSRCLCEFNAHIGIEEFQQRLLQARDQDEAQLITKLNTLSENDQRILNALKYQDGVQRRVEELLVGVLRCVQNLGTDQSPQARFLRNASTVLQRASKGHIPDISADYVITSLEVDFQDTDSIGQGAFGRVFKGEWNGSRVAIKQMHIDNARTMSEDDRKFMYREVRLWKGLHHPNILNLYGACLEATSPFLVMQYCPFGNMCHYLVEHPETNRVDILYDIVAGMTYLHNKGVVHADLKGANILIYKGVALVADFGLSAVIDGIQSRSALSSMATSVRGTPRWMAPECHKGEPPRKASDVYSLGLTMWEAFSGKIPYEDVRRHGLTYIIAIEHRRPERPASLTETAIWDIIQECWAPVAEERPSIQKVQGKLSLYTTRRGSFVRSTLHC
ncbi:kinase-like domain-containing protein [Russula brevipes]|nr:kinase-like domain-containing protein [Russula brevipes]